MFSATPSHRLSIQYTKRFGLKVKPIQLRKILDCDCSILDRNVALTERRNDFYFQMVMFILAVANTSKKNSLL